MFVTTNRVLCIEAHKNADGVTDRLRIKNGNEFFTAFLSKKLPPLPESIKDGSQLDLSGFIKAKSSEKYGMQFTMTATSVIERDYDNPARAKSTTTEPGEPVSEAPGKK